MLQVLRSILITLIIAAGLGYALNTFFGGFLQGFILFTILQFIIFYFWKNSRINNVNNVVEALTRDIENILSRQEVNVTCPCGKNTIPVVVFPDEVPIVTCDKCNNSFRVVTDINTQLITEPVNMEQIFNQLKGTSVE